METWLIENPGMTGILFIMSLIAFIPSYFGVESIKRQAATVDQSAPEFQDVLEKLDYRAFLRGITFTFMVFTGAFLLAGILVPVFD